MADRRSILLPAPQRILPPTQIQSVGQVGNVRAGRVLANADFTDIGLAAPRALWNLTDLTDASGGGFTLTNGGAVSVGGSVKGITGAAGEAAFFPGGATSFLSAVTGIKQAFGSWGCWFKTGKRGVEARFLGHYRAPGAGGDLSMTFGIRNTNNLIGLISTVGADTAYWTVEGSAIVTDDRWHHAVMTWDGVNIVVYLDGNIEARGANATVGVSPYGPAFTGGTALLYLGNIQNGVTQALVGSMDEVFVTSDVLDEDQVRYLYATKINHFAPNPVRIEMNVDRRKRSGAFVAGDFPTQPLVGYNFNTGALGTDNFGSLNKALTNNGVATECPDVDGARVGGVNFLAASSQNLSAADTSLPAGVAACSMGVWFKAFDNNAAARVLMSYGSVATIRQLWLAAGDGTLRVSDGAGTPLSTAAERTYADGTWHFAVVTIDNAAADGLKQKLYVDGVLVASATTLTGPTLLGANGFRIGSDTTPTSFMNGQVGAAFICGYALTAEQVRSLYDKPGAQAYGSRSPIDASPFIERVTSTAVYLVVEALNGTDLIEVEAVLS